MRSRQSGRLTVPSWQCILAVCRQTFHQFDKVTCPETQFQLAKWELDLRSPVVINQRNHARDDLYVDDQLR